MERGWYCAKADSAPSRGYNQRRRRQNQVGCIRYDGICEPTTCVGVKLSDTEH